jgi:hypothetical protein
LATVAFRHRELLIRFDNLDRRSWVEMTFSEVLALRVRGLHLQHPELRQVREDARNRFDGVRGGNIDENVVCFREVAWDRRVLAAHTSSVSAMQESECG